MISLVPLLFAFFLMGIPITFSLGVAAVVGLLLVLAEMPGINKDDIHLDL